MESCQQVEPKHYVTHYGATFVAKILQNLAQTEEARPTEQRNPTLELLLALGVFSCNLAKVAVNQNLCLPIDTRYVLRA